MQVKLCALVDDILLWDKIAVVPLHHEVEVVGIGSAAVASATALALVPVAGAGTVVGSWKLL